MNADYLKSIALSSDNQDNSVCFQIDLILKALSVRLCAISEILNHSEENSVLNKTLELQLNQWVAVFFFYTTQEEKYLALLSKRFQSLKRPSVHSGVKHVDLDNHLILATSGIQVSNDAVIETVQDVLDEMRSIGRTILISRLKRNLQFKILKLRNEFSDYIDFVEAVTFPSIQALDVENEIGDQFSLLRDEEADDKNWVLEWMSCSLKHSCPLHSRRNFSE